MSKKTVTIFGATGTACVNELINHELFDVCVLARKPGQRAVFIGHHPER